MSFCTALLPDCVCVLLLERPLRNPKLRHQRGSLLSFSFKQGCVLTQQQTAADSHCKRTQLFLHFSRVVAARMGAKESRNGILRRPHSTALFHFHFFPQQACFHDFSSPPLFALVRSRFSFRFSFLTLPQVLIQLIRFSGLRHPHLSHAATQQHLLRFLSLRYSVASLLPCHRSPACCGR